MREGNADLVGNDLSKAHEEALGLSTGVCSFSGYCCHAESQR